MSDLVTDIDFKQVMQDFTAGTEFDSVEYDGSYAVLEGVLWIKVVAAENGESTSIWIANCFGTFQAAMDLQDVMEIMATGTV